MTAAVTEKENFSIGNTTVVFFDHGSSVTATPGNTQVVLVSPALLI